VIAYVVRMAVRNPVAVNLATLAVIAAGVMAYFSMPREVFPEFTLGTVTVTTVYPGASPEDVERLVTFRSRMSLRVLTESIRPAHARSRVYRL